MKTEQLPPVSPFMQHVQRVLVKGSQGDWATLRPAAFEYSELCGGTFPIDTTRLPRWWEEYAKDALRNLDPRLTDGVIPFDVCAFINREGGKELGISVRDGFLIL